MNDKSIFDYPVFALGFRSFFLCAGLSALVLIALWKAMYSGHLQIHTYYPSSLWHAHEMLLGYTIAVIAGFLLTAVKNWTGKMTLSGIPLAVLSLLWLYGRILPFYSGILPDLLIALADFAFLPWLAYQIGKPIVKTRQYYNLVFVALLLLLALGNGLVHAQMLQWTEATAASGIQMVLGVIIIMILIIIGRVFPFFTERGLPGTRCITDVLLDKLCVATAIYLFMVGIFQGTGVILALAAVMAAASNGMRWLNWYMQRVWYVPLLWVLYTGYAWIIIGFVLTGFSAFNLVSSGQVLHAYTMGGIGVLTLGMMARVSLGHTGRALRASRVMAIGFVLINLAVVFRVLLPVVFSGWYVNAIIISSALWLLAFLLFAFIYLPILTTPRIDGRPG